MEVRVAVGRSVRKWTELNSPSVRDLRSPVAHEASDDPPERAGEKIGNPGDYNRSEAAVQATVCALAIVEKVAEADRRLGQTNRS
jgi:hypothetical protein